MSKAYYIKLLEHWYRNLEPRSWYEQMRWLCAGAPPTDWHELRGALLVMRLRYPIVRAMVIMHTDRV